MRRWAVLFVVAAAGAGIVVLLIPSEEVPTPVPQPATQAQKPLRCPEPRVTNLTAHPVSEDGERISLRGRAYVERGGIGSIQVTWGDQGAVIADMWTPRQVALKFFEHRYPRPGTYRISVVADAATRGGCRLQESPPATLLIRVPLSRTSYPSSL